MKQSVYVNPQIKKRSTQAYTFLGLGGGGSYETAFMCITTKYKRTPQVLKFTSPIASSLAVSSAVLC